MWAHHCQQTSINDIIGQTCKIQQIDIVGKNPARFIYIACEMVLGFIYCIWREHGALASFGFGRFFLFQFCIHYFFLHQSFYFVPFFYALCLYNLLSRCLHYIALRCIMYNLLAVHHDADVNITKLVLAVICASCTRSRFHWNLSTNGQ